MSQIPPPIPPQFSSPSPLPDPLPSLVPRETPKKKSLLSKLSIPGAILAGVGLLWILFDNSGSNDLRVSIQPGLFGHNLSIQNIGDKPITILDVKVNNRDECIYSNDKTVRTVQALGQLIQNGNPTKNQSSELQIGDIVTIPTTCNVVRATIATNNGVDEYTFSAR